MDSDDDAGTTLGTLEVVDDDDADVTGGGI